MRAGQQSGTGTTVGNLANIGIGAVTTLTAGALGAAVGMVGSDDFDHGMSVEEVGGTVLGTAVAAGIGGSIAYSGGNAATAIGAAMAGAAVLGFALGANIPGDARA